VGTAVTIERASASTPLSRDVETSLDGQPRSAAGGESSVTGLDQRCTLTEARSMPVARCRLASAVRGRTGCLLAIRNAGPCIALD